MYLPLASTCCRHLYSKDEEAIFGHTNTTKPLKAQWWSCWGSTDYDSEHSGGSGRGWPTWPYVYFMSSIQLSLQPVSPDFAISDMFFFNLQKWIALPTLTGCWLCKILKLVTWLMYCLVGPEVSQMSSRLSSESRVYANKAKDLNRQVWHMHMQPATYWHWVKWFLMWTSKVLILVNWHHMIWPFYTFLIYLPGSNNEVSVVV